jgi:uroporphyrinogen decarboxylase
MTSRERVRRCLEFDHPDQVPRDLWVLPIARLEHGDEALEAFQRRWPIDFARPGIVNPQLLALVEGDAYAAGTYRDEWGCTFENVHAGVIGQVKQPILDDWSKLEDLRPPTEVLKVDVNAVNRACAATDKFVLADCCPRPFERMQFLRGTQRLFLDLARDPPELHVLLKLIHDLNCRELDAWSSTAVDAVMFMDDWGSQQNLLIAPERWRSMFKPLYADYVRIAHEAGKKIFMHSDGHIFEIYEDLIEIGVDAINSQLFCMDIEQIGRRFAGRITFWGEIDRQHVLPGDSRELARAAVQRVVDNLYRPEGGVIAQFELGAGARLENAEVVFQTWQDLTASAPP